MDNGQSHDFALSTVEKVRKACSTLGYADFDSLETFGWKLEDHILFMCRAVENMRQQKVVIDGGMQLFRIRHKKTGKFKKGGSRLGWSEQGKAWTKAGHLKNHLNMHMRAIYYPGTYRRQGREYVPEVADWEVVEYRPDRIIVKSVQEFHPAELHKPTL